jgi:hypothetical protein
MSKEKRKGKGNDNEFEEWPENFEFEEKLND